MKNIFDFTHVKSVRAWALLHKGKMAGKIIANFSDNPAGSVCTAQVIFWTGPLASAHSETIKGPALGKAGGYGYDKFSAAVSDSLAKLGLDWKEFREMSGTGDSAVKGYLEKKGYTVLEVI